jgi:hypothetical protein
MQHLNHFPIARQVSLVLSLTPTTAIGSFTAATATEAFSSVNICSTLISFSVGASSKTLLSVSEINGFLCTKRLEKTKRNHQTKNKTEVQN